MKTVINKLVVFACLASLISILLYLNVRILLLLITDYTLKEKVLAFFLLLAETFILIHSTGYFLNIIHVVRSKSKPSLPKTLQTYPPVAIVVASYKEPLSILRDTLICFYNLTYPNKHLFLLDDTRYDLPWDTPENRQKYRKAVEELCREIGIQLFRAKWHGAKAGMLNDFLQFLANNPREDFEIYPYGLKTYTPLEPPKYMIVFDADMNPIPDFVEHLVPIMEAKPRLAFIQTPQYYTNFEFNRVARASGLQQAIFYEYICEGKGTHNSMFCCGTNVLLRREALMDVGGFDEVSVTEDFATSLKFHLKGWESFYLNRVSAFGMGPEDLGAYFKQQFRWAKGTLGILKQLPKEFFKHFNRFSLNMWWEYFLSSTHYLVGWAFFILVLYPVFYLFFDMPSYFARPEIYFLVFIPYITITLAVFFWTLKQRKYRFKDLLCALVINAVTFPIYMKASLAAMFGKKGGFGVTPKGESQMLPLTSLLPQLLAALLCASAIVWGLLRLYFEREPFYALIINIFWTLFNFIIISTFLYFNHSKEIAE